MTNRTVTKLEDGLVGMEDWERRWSEGQIGWQAAIPKGYLTDNADKLLLQKPCRVFVPLCGKTPELMWLYKNGHTVVGNEFVESPVRDLFEENNVTFSVGKLNNTDCNIYSSEDGRLVVYQGDLFNLTKEILGTFDVIWDCNSLTAVNKEDRVSYVDLILSIMNQDSRYLLVTKEFDPAVWQGPPHTVDECCVKQLLDDRCTVQIVSTFDRATQKKKTENAGSKEGETTPAPKLEPALVAIATSPYYYEKAYLIQLK